MKLLSIGKSDLKTPYIGMGTWAIGGGVWWGENDDVLSIHTVHEALDHGITWIDTAPGIVGVGHSEEVVGKALKDRRHSAIHFNKMWAGMETRDPMFPQNHRRETYLPRSVCQKYPSGRRRKLKTSSD